MTDQYISPDELRGQFELLDNAMSDPYVDRILESARTYNKLFETEEIDDHEAAAIIEELDTQWGTLFGMPMKLSGHAIFPNQNPVNPEMETRYYEDLTVVSNGFAIAEHGEDFEGHKILLQLLKPIPPALQTEGGGQYWIGYADVDKAILDIPAASFERSIAWLSVFYPDFIDEMDQRTLNAGGTEADAVMSLKGMEIPAFSDDEREFAQQCIGSYLHAILQFDDAMPYQCSIKGEVLIRDDEGNDAEYAVESNDSLLFVSTVAPGIADETDGPRGILALKGTMINRDRLHPGISITIPLDSITGLRSMREDFFKPVD